MSQTYNSSCLCGQKDEKNKCCFKIELFEILQNYEIT